MLGIVPVSSSSMPLVVNLPEGRPPANPFIRCNVGNTAATQIERMSTNSTEGLISTSSSSAGTRPSIVSKLQAAKQLDLKIQEQDSLLMQEIRDIVTDNNRGVVTKYVLLLNLLKSDQDSLVLDSKLKDEIRAGLGFDDDDSLNTVSDLKESISDCFEPINIELGSCRECDGMFSIQLLDGVRKYKVSSCQRYKSESIRYLIDQQTKKSFILRRCGSDCTLEYDFSQDIRQDIDDIKEKLKNKDLLPCIRYQLIQDANVLTQYVKEKYIKEKESQSFRFEHEGRSYIVYYDAPFSFIESDGKFLYISDSKGRGSSKEAFLLADIEGHPSSLVWLSFYEKTRDIRDSILRDRMFIQELFQAGLGFLISQVKFPETKDQLVQVEKSKERFFTIMDNGGESLFRLIRSQSLPLDCFLDIGTQLVDLAKCFKNAGVLCRDIKSENLVWSPESGLKQIDSEFWSKDSDSSGSVGTPEFLSPEEITYYMNRRKIVINECCYAVISRVGTAYSLISETGIPYKLEVKGDTCQLIDPQTRQCQVLDQKPILLRSEGDVSSQTIEDLLRQDLWKYGLVLLEILLSRTLNGHDLKNVHLGDLDRLFDEIRQTFSLAVTESRKGQLEGLLEQCKGFLQREPHNRGFI